MVVAVGTGLAVGCLGTAKADVNDITFDAVTSAYGVIGTLANESIPTGITLEGSGPTSQARLTSLAQSTAFASLPYPGDVGAHINGPVNALTGLPVPPYPFYIESANGSPSPQGGHFPGIDLTAKSTDTLSTAKAVAITEAVGYVAESTVSQDKQGAVTAVSTATQNGLQIGGVLTLSGVVSTARAVLSPTGETTTKSDLTIGRFIAPALEIAPPDQFCPPNQPCTPDPFKGQVLHQPKLSYSDKTFYVSLPGAGDQKYPVPEDAVVKAFKAIGVDVTFQDAITTKTGVVAPTLELKSVLPSPPSNQLYNGATPVTYTIGRTAANIQGSAAQPSIAPAPGTAVSGPTTASAPSTAPQIALGAAPLAGGLPAELGPPATAPAAPATPVVTLTPVRHDHFISATSARPLPDVSNFYLVLIGVGLITFVGLFAARALR
jgi:hypothetical protein